MIQSYLLTQLTQNFGEKVKNKREFLVHTTARFKIKNSMKEIDVLDADHQRR
jgi:hypothetical protein